MAIEVTKVCGTIKTTEAGYMAAVEADKEVLWMKDFIGELRFRQEELRLYCDNQSAIHLAKNVAYLKDQAHPEEISLAPREGIR